MSYFPVWYFPSGSTPAPDPADSEDFLGALKAYFHAQPELAAITGGLFLDQAGDRSQLPYATVQEAGARLDLVTSSSTVHDTRIKFTVYANELDTAGQLGNLISDAFVGRSFSWAGGNASALVRHDRKHRKDKGRGKDTKKVWHLEVEFQSRVRRSS